VTEAARRAIADVAGIKSVFATVGEGQQTATGPAQAGEVRKGILTVTLTERDSRPSQLAIENAVRERLEQVPGARFAIGGGGAPGEKLQIVLASDNAPALRSTAQALERELRALGYLENVSSTASLERPEIVIRPNVERMTERGVTTAAVGATVRIATSGDFDAQLAKLNLDARQIDIRVRFADDYRTDLATFGNLRVPGRYGSVPLSSIAELTVESGPTQLDRYDRRRYVAVNADLAGYPLGDALAAARELPSMAGRPSSVDFLELGDVELMTELFTGFGVAIATGVLCVLCVLVLLFKDFLQPVTILSALPLSIGGSFIALLITGGSLDLPSLIGIVMLMGIVTKNSILLVDYTFMGIRDRGLSMHEALVDACHKRARPIVMTSVAMIAGMVPLALGFSGDASFRAPMAITVIGGLVTSTALSLLIVPVAFTYVLGLERRLKNLFGRSESTSPPLAART
jgi:multidrug efflux pump subunit AcrB